MSVLLEASVRELPHIVNVYTRKPMLPQTCKQKTMLFGFSEPALIKIKKKEKKSIRLQSQKSSCALEIFRCTMRSAMHCSHLRSMEPGRLMGEQRAVLAPFSPVQTPCSELLLALPPQPPLSPGPPPHQTAPAQASKARPLLHPRCAQCPCESRGR